MPPSQQGLLSPLVTGLGGSGIAMTCPTSSGVVPARESSLSRCASAPSSLRRARPDQMGPHGRDLLTTVSMGGIILANDRYICHLSHLIIRATGATIPGLAAQAGAGPRGRTGALWKRRSADVRKGERECPGGRWHPGKGGLGAAAAEADFATTLRGAGCRLLRRGDRHRRRPGRLQQLAGQG